MRARPVSKSGRSLATGTREIKRCLNGPLTEIKCAPIETGYFPPD
jgi:hypothetical protein